MNDLSNDLLEMATRIRSLCVLGFGLWEADRLTEAASALQGKNEEIAELEGQLRSREESRVQPAPSDNHAKRLTTASELPVPVIRPFRCGHPSTPENAAKVGKGRVACRICRQAWLKRNPRHSTPAPSPTPALGRPVTGLRRFSWEAGEET